MRNFTSAILVVLLATAPSARGAVAPRTNQVRLYQPNDVLVERIGEDAGTLAAYIKNLQTENAEFWAKHERTGARGLLVAVGVRPGRKSRVWCEAVDGAINPKDLERLRAKLEAVPAPEVQGGPLAFALEFTLEPGSPPQFPAMPAAWKNGAASASKPLVVPEGLFPLIWP